MRKPVLKLMDYIDFEDTRGAQSRDDLSDSTCAPYGLEMEDCESLAAEGSSCDSRQTVKER